MTIPFGLANALDSIPIVQSTTDRNTKYPSVFVPGGPPAVQPNQRVQNLQTQAIERWNGLTWLSPDPAFAISTGGSGGGGGGSAFPLAGQPGVLGTGFFAIVDTIAHRNALNPAAFTIVENLQTGNLEIWNGSQWFAVVEGIGGAGTQPPTGTVGSYAAGRANAPWFNVSVFGATGNGVNDDTSAFAAAISAATALPAGGVVFVPPGKYLIGGQLQWSPNVSFFAIPGSAVIIPFAAGGPCFASPTGGIAGACFMYGFTFDATQGPSASTAAQAILIAAMATGATVTIDACSFKLTQVSGVGAAVAAVGANPGILVRNSTVVASNGGGLVTGGPVINCTIQSVANGVAIAGAGSVKDNTIVTGTGTAAITILGTRTQVSGNTIQLWNGHGIALGTTGLQELRIINNEIGAIQGSQNNAININDATFARNLLIANNNIDNTAGSCIFVSAQGCGGVVITGNNTHIANAGGASIPTTGANGAIEVQGGVDVSIIGNTHFADTGDNAAAQVYLGTLIPVNVSIIGNTCFVHGGQMTTQIHLGSALDVEQAGNVMTQNGGSAAPQSSGLQTLTGISGSIYQGAVVTITSSTNYTGYVPVMNTGLTSGAHQLPGTIRVNATSGNVTVTLPAANACVGAVLYIKRTDSSANTVTVAQQTSPADTIDGSASNKTIAALGVLRLQSAGPSSGAANWDVL